VTLPNAYVGTWTTNVRACGAEDTNAVTISPSSLAFYEAQGDVRAIVEGDRQITATVAYNGEGKSWVESNVLVPMGSKKLMLTALGKTTELRRCPVPKVR
jgi:hypothetical protein